ncbi:MAG: 4Fe-4S dicluster domain-containing protein [Thermodesulfobacteriota bacterium]
MRSQNSLTEQLERLAFQGGADLFGIADLSPARDFIITQGGGWLGRFPRAISLGMRLSDLIVDQHHPHEPRRQSFYWHHVYNVVTPALDFLAYDLSRWLTQKGFAALPIPASPPYNYETLLGIFSHKLAAHLAGLGWIGKSCLLVSQKYGPRVRFVSILTDAPLLVGKSLDNSCGNCHLCVDSCPVGAFTGREFIPDEPRELRFQALKCSEFRRDHPCGLCVSSCPQGKKNTFHLKTTP